MRKVFQAELDQIGDGLIGNFDAGQRTPSKSPPRAFQNADVDLAQDVIAADARIDFLQNDLDERAIDILALQGPVASDLRMIVGSLRMSASLERMGDLARHVAQLARLRYPALTYSGPAAGRRSMSWRPWTSGLPASSPSCLETRDLDAGHATSKANKARINELHRSVFGAIAAPDWQETAATTVDVTLASRYFERFGDHGVSVARKVSYLVTGAWQPESFAQ